MHNIKKWKFCGPSNERAFYYNHIFASCNRHLATDGSSFLLKQNRTTRYVFIIEVHCFVFTVLYYLYCLQ